jgi:large subunit ribosomal protein L20
LPRVKRGVTGRRKHKSTLELTKGQRMTKNNLYRRSHEAMMKSLWIARINAATKAEGMKYNELIDGLNKAGIAVNRKMLADMAVQEPAAFTNLVTLAKGKASA